jgi:hypothetical protein
MGSNGQQWRSAGPSRILNGLIRLRLLQYVKVGLFVECGNTPIGSGCFLF